MIAALRTIVPPTFPKKNTLGRNEHPTLRLPVIFLVGNLQRTTSRQIISGLIVCRGLMLREKFIEGGGLPFEGGTDLNRRMPGRISPANYPYS